MAVDIDRAARRHTRSLINVLKRHLVDPMCGAEVGVQDGTTSQVLLDTFRRLNLYMVDTWRQVDVNSPYFQSGDCLAKLDQRGHEKNMHAALDVTEFACDRRSVLRMESVEAAATIDDSSLAFAFIDADHTYQAVQADIDAWWPKVQRGGILCGHDYGAIRDRRGYWGVSRAVDEFVAQEGVRLCVEREYIWWVKRS